jgi:hypothetical protein
MRRKHRRSKKIVCYKTRNLRYRCTTRKLEWLLKLYSRKLFSTIDPYKNGENAFIYSKQQQQQNRDVALKLCVCMASDNLLLQSLSDRALVADAIELLIVPWANRRALNSSSDFPIMAEAMSNHHQPPQ